MGVYPHAERIQVNMLRDMQRGLRDHYGPLGWWPAETPDEIVIGAVLTQGTSWISVEKALHNLKQAGVHALVDMIDLDAGQLITYIRPAGCFRRKARTLLELAALVHENHTGVTGFLSGTETDGCRRQLLAIPGIGPETADAILLYVGNRPTFVVDAYARRLLSRHGIEVASSSYEGFQAWVVSHLPGDLEMMKEFHAGIVETGKQYCLKRTPRCDCCPLGSLLSRARRDALMDGSGGPVP